MQENVEVAFHSGSIFTGSGQPVTGVAVLVNDGRISAIVPEDQLRAHTGPNTRLIDLDGALLSPGFQDSHIHPAEGGTELLQCNLSEAENAQEAVEAIAAYAAANPEVPWIQGGGWSMDHYEGGAPLASLIDAVLPDRPVALSSRDHHSMWANSEAFRLAGIDANTPDPADGYFERLVDGSPAGTLHEGAMDLIAAHAPKSTDDFLLAGLLRAQDDLIAQGITGWQDAMVNGNPENPSTSLAYERALADGTLKVRVRGAQWWARDAGLEQIPALVATRARAEALGLPERFNLGTIKIMVDGIAENYTASMIEPYRDKCGHKTDNTGLSFISAENLASYVTALDAEGFQVHFHALGDAAVRDALDAVAAARAANGPSANRHHLAHLQVVSEADAARFADLDAVANLQPLWACHEDQLDTLTLPFMPESAQDRQYPFGDLVAGGARLAAGSDWPVSSADPIAGAHIAVNRIAPEEHSVPLGGEKQCLDLSTIWAAYTSGTAYVNHREDSTGSIAPGYFADLVVVSPNPFAVPSSEIHNSRVVSTWIDGECVYRASDVAAEQGA
ncbi:amidohydrolase [Paeniglutamicibacter psychrophenolicus]|uniref:Amidohydrolase YtcJ n=1 Tax=Paeniglutamicibacter psychrophenolicus TaxID=257454 RepID=A0ABS4W9R0_9MICC|nr:amidohydrolase [Paeniglutamicibacter psychrophenolicus]MBP2372928.1 putative amidohydrolase YtcJ [Paeniglutamicibacter psychrophenolicus]